MAEKILNTRILMKVDTLENWSNSTLKLKEGELAFATVAASAGTGLEEPVVMVKIGTAEEKTFSELPWAFHAKAADVLAACKTEAGLKAFVNNVIAEAGIASSSAMEALAGRVTTAEGKITTLEGEMDAVEAKAAANETAIGALKELVGDETVTKQIQDAIALLELANTYEAKGEAAKVQTALDTYKTANDKAVADNKAAIEAEAATARAAEKKNSDAIDAIKDGTTLDSFADVETALAGKETSGAAAQALADAKVYADGLAGNYDTKGAAAAAETAAKAYADGLAGNYDAAGSAAQALTDANAYTDGEIAEWVGDKTVSVQISEAIAAEKLSETYAAKVHKHTKSDITDFAHTHEISEVNGLQDALDGKQAVGDYATKAEAQGYADAKDEAIQAAQDAANKAQKEVDDLEKLVGVIPEGYTEESVVAYINKKAEETLAAASGNSSETAASVKQQLDDYKDENDPKVQANTDAIADLEELVGDKSVTEQITDVTDPLAARVKTIEDDYLVEADKTELEGKITANANAIALLTNGVSAEEVDGVNDLIQYVKEHGTEVTGMKEDISDNAAAIKVIADDYLVEADKTELSGLITGLDTRMGAAETAIGTKAAQTDLEALAGRVSTVESDLNTESTGLKARMTTAESDIAGLKGLVGDKTVTEQITTITDPLTQRVVDLEAVDHDHGNKTVLDGITADQVAAWDVAVQTVTAAAGSGLTATKTGTDVVIAFDDSVTFIFDCGDSSNV